MKCVMILLIHVYQYISFIYVSAVNVRKENKEKVKEN